MACAAARAVARARVTASGSVGPVSKPWLAQLECWVAQYAGRRDGGGQPRLRFGAGLVRRKGVRGCLTPSPSDTAGSRQALEEGALAGVFDEDESSPARRRGESLVRVADGRAAGLVRAGFEFVLPGPLSLFFELYRW